MVFTYTAKSQVGKTTAGIIEAATVAEARHLLRGQGLFPLSLVQGVKSKGRKRSGASGRRRRVAKRELLMATSQLAIMCRAGVNLAEALKNVGDHCSNEALGLVLRQVYEDVSSGSPASVAMRKHPQVFDAAYVASIAAAEASGEVTSILSRLADLIRSEIRLQSSLRSTLAYPVILVAVAMVVILALVFFVLPQFATIFADLGAPVPPLTEMLLGGAQFLRQHILIVLGCAAVVVAGSVWGLRTETAQRRRDALMLNLPLLRGSTRALQTGRAFRIMGTMLQSGIPLLEAIRLCGASVRNRLYRDLFALLEEEVVTGGGIGNRLAAAEFVPPGAAQMVATAEQTGELGPVIQIVGEFYEDDGERSMRQLVKLMEPAIIVAMGVVVAGVVLAVILPLLDISTMAA